MDGFSYNGVHCSFFNCGYIPSETERQNQTPEYEVKQVEVTDRNGGYYFSNRVKIREFVLSCYFEDISLSTREKMFRWLDRNTKGKLIFDERPFVYYEVRPIRKINGRIYRNRNMGANEFTYSGTFTITFAAYDPFGYMTYQYYDGIDKDGAGRYCNILAKDEMPPLPSTAITGMPNQVYNCGTQPCDTVIRLAGTAPNGQSVYNRSNGQRCTLLSLPAEGYLEINTTKGTVETVLGAGRQLSYELHDDGYIELIPSDAIQTQAMVSYTKDSNKALLDDSFPRTDLVGKYVYLRREWIRIIATLEDGSIVLSKTMKSSGAVITKIVDMNEIEQEGDGASLTKFEIDYTPRVY